MKNSLEKTSPEDFEQFGYETMFNCYDIEQAGRTCAPVLQAYEISLRRRLQGLRFRMLELNQQFGALHSNLYDRPNPVNDARMLAHSRKIFIVAFFALLTGIACLVGNMTTFYLLGFGPLVSFLGGIGMTALPLGIGHMGYEWIVGTSRWIKVTVVLVAVLLAASGIVIAGHARRDMIDRSFSAPSASSYVDGSEDIQAPDRPEPQEKTESGMRRTLGDGIFLFTLAAELGLAFLVGWFIELYGDPDYVAWRELGRVERELSEVSAKIIEITDAPELARKCCLAGIQRAANARPRRRPPYHQALTLLLLVVFLFVIPFHAQTAERYDGILIDTSASISHGGRSNELFHEYLVAIRKLLLNEPPNSRVWVFNISSDSFGGSQQILKGWTPDAHGVFTDDVKRARIELASAFEKESAEMAPLAGATDIFGGLWRLKAYFESAKNEGPPKSKTIYIFSDMMNETKAFPMPELLESSPTKMLDQARANGSIVPLSGCKVYVYGASTAGLSPQAWVAIKGFWLRYFAVAGATVTVYSADDYSQ
jgi:hypothetical protein